MPGFGDPDQTGLRDRRVNPFGLGRHRGGILLADHHQHRAGNAWQFVMDALAVDHAVHRAPDAAAIAGELLLPVAPLLRPGRRSEEHTSELQSLMRISYAGFCLKKTKT